MIIFNYGNLPMRSLFIAALILLAGCNSVYQLPRPTTEVISQAEQRGMSLQQYPTQTFVISAYERLPAKAVSTVHVYIEGDGNSWKSKYRLSKNPTPKHPLALALALRDPYSHVIYLARPCQYTPHELDTTCVAKYWSSHRYAPEVLTAMNETLDQIKAKTHAQHFVLVGFSGGASIATLLSAQRNDIVNLITVAGDLNHQALNQYHHTSPLTGSLNPTTYAVQLKDLPQHHWAGSEDPIVPPWVAEQFAVAVNSPNQVHVHTLPGATHHRGWTERWDEILKVSL
jgi:pimeloyl-ACP methyl ester carboxylesterase